MARHGTTERKAPEWGRWSQFVTSLLVEKEGNFVKKTGSKSFTPIESIDRRIYLIRGQRVMLDSDLAEVYGVPTKVLVQALKRNRGRFPGDFAYQLNGKEFASLRSQSVTSNSGRGGRRYPPHLGTEAYRTT